MVISELLFILINYACCKQIDVHLLPSIELPIPEGGDKAVAAVEACAAAVISEKGAKAGAEARKLTGLMSDEVTALILDSATLEVGAKVRSVV